MKALLVEAFSDGELIAWLKSPKTKLTVQMMAYSFKMRPQAVTKRLEKLVKAGKLAKIRSGKVYQYHLPEAVS